MAALAPGDPKLVSMIVNHLKSQGLFDQFRRDCLADVDTKPAYQNLRQRVDNFVSNHLASHTWSPHLNKNQLRNSLRQMVLQSGMLEVGVDRIISQVVDPKINHIFRPQVEKAVHEFLATLDRKEEPTAVSLVPNSEKSEPTTPGLLSVGPSTSKADDALSILDTITSLNQEASAARSTVENSSNKNGEKTSKKNLTSEFKTQQSFDLGMEKDHTTEEIEKLVLETKIDDGRICSKSEGSINVLMPEKDFEEKKETPEIIEECVEDMNAIKDKIDKVDKKDVVVLRRDEYFGLSKEERRGKGKECESVKYITAALTIKQKAKENLKKEYSLDDSDFEGLSDITVSSVHTSDLSSFDVDDDEEEEGEVMASDSTEEDQDQSSEEKDTKSGTNEDQKESRAKPVRHPYVHKPFLYSKYYSDSDDEETVVQRRQSIAKQKAERLLRRQWNRERGDDKHKQVETDKDRPPKERCSDEECHQTLQKGINNNLDVVINSRKMQQSAALNSKVNKATLKEQKVLEKKVALRRKRKGDLRTLSEERVLHEDRKRKRAQPEDFKERQSKMEFLFQSKEKVATSSVLKDSRSASSSDVPSRPVRRFSECIQSNDMRNEVKIDHEPCRKQLRSNSSSQDSDMEALKVSTNNKVNNFESDGNINENELSKQKDEGKHIKESDEQVVVSESGYADGIHVDVDQKLRNPSEEKAIPNCLYVIVSKSDNKTPVSSNSSDSSVIEQSQDVKPKEHSKVKEEKGDEKGKEKRRDSESFLSKSRDNIQEDAKGHEKNKEKRNEAEINRPKFKENSQEDINVSEKVKEKQNNSENPYTKFQGNTHEYAKSHEKSKEKKNEVEQSRAKFKEIVQDDKSKEKRNDSERSRSQSKESMQEDVKRKERRSEPRSSWSKSRERVQEDSRSHEKVKEIQAVSDSPQSKLKENFQEDVRSKEKRKNSEDARLRSKEDLHGDRRNEKRIERRHNSESSQSKLKEIVESSRSKSKDTVESTKSRPKDCGESSQSKSKDSTETSRSKSKDSIESSRSKSKDAVESLKSKFKDNVESLHSKSKDNIESLRLKPRDSIESSRSKPRDGFESPRSKSRDSIESSWSKSKDSTESSASKSKDITESSRSKPKDNAEGLRSKSKDCIESFGLKSKDSVENLRSKSKGGIEYSRSKSMDSAESSRSKPKDGTESSRSKPKDSGEILRSKPKDITESSRSKPKDSGESSRSKPRDSFESSQPKSKDSCGRSRPKSKDNVESSRSKTKDSIESSRSKLKNSCENLHSKSKDNNENLRSKPKDSSEIPRSKSKDSTETSQSKSKDSTESSQSEFKDRVESLRPKSKDSREISRLKSKGSSEISRSESKDNSEISLSKSKSNAESWQSKSKDSAESPQSKSKDSAESPQSKSKDSGEISRSKFKENIECTQKGTEERHATEKIQFKTRDSEISQLKPKDKLEANVQFVKAEKSHDSESESRQKVRDGVQDNEKGMEKKPDYVNTWSKAKDHSESFQSKFKENMQDDIQSNKKETEKRHDSKSIYFEKSRSKSKEYLQEDDVNKKMEKIRDVENVQSQSWEPFEHSWVKSKEQPESTQSKCEENLLQAIQNSEKGQDKCLSENIRHLKSVEQPGRSRTNEDEENIQDNEKGEEKKNDFQCIQSKSKESSENLQEKPTGKAQSCENDVEKKDNLENIQTRSLDKIQNNRGSEELKENESQNYFSKSLAVGYQDAQNSEAKRKLENLMSAFKENVTPSKGNGTEERNKPENDQPESEAYLLEAVKSSEIGKKNYSESLDSKLEDRQVKDIDETDDTGKMSANLVSSSKEKVQADPCAEKGTGTSSSQFKSEESMLDTKGTGHDAGDLKVEAEKFLKSENKLEERNEAFESGVSESKHLKHVPNGEKEHKSVQIRTGNCSAALLQKEQTEDPAHDQAARLNELNIPPNVDQQESLLPPYQTLPADTPTLNDASLQHPAASLAQFVHYNPSSPATPTLDESFSYEASSGSKDVVESSVEDSEKQKACTSENIKQVLCKEQQAEELESKYDLNMKSQELPVQQDVVSEIITSAICEWKDEAAEEQSVKGAEEQSSCRRERKPKRPYSPVENPSKRRHLHSEEKITMEEDMHKPYSEAVSAQVPDVEKPTQSRGKIAAKLEERTRNQISDLNIQNKPTTRAAKRISSPEHHSVTERERRSSAPVKEKLTSDIKAAKAPVTMSVTRSRSQLSPVTKQGRKREASPGEHRRGHHKNEVPPKRTRR
ncbi:biorientation of chromosomes in cell division protein 1-like 1 [Stegostoma tigrinum]|uniref:biorientation of chromosomes in cell division protein 1-like 1 n=1 Tax=Stegostoma tigrinum TaxID=3053191 RepID=UPI00287001AC|nr:biorientation of chromosomes in cell division protein 1-like 1 [Stegostoma tigrinum]